MHKELLQAPHPRHEANINVAFHQFHRIGTSQSVMIWYLFATVAENDQQNWLKIGKWSFLYHI